MLMPGASERCPHRLGAGLLVAFQRVDDRLDVLAGTDEGGAATGDDTLFDGCTDRRHGVFDAVLLLLELHLGGGADLDQCHTAGQLRETLLELLTIPVGVGVLDLGLDLVDATVDVGVARRHHRRWSCCPW